MQERLKLHRDHDDDPYVGLNVQQVVFETMRKVAEIHTDPRAREPSLMRSPVRLYHVTCVDLRECPCSASCVVCYAANLVVMRANIQTTINRKSLLIPVVPVNASAGQNITKRYWIGNARKRFTIENMVLGRVELTSQGWGLAEGCARGEGRCD